MYLQQLSITNFRNYPLARLDFSPHWNLFSGDNGSGKTTLLDAIHYLCLGKSYFHHSDLTSVKHDSDFFRIDGSFSDDQVLRMVCFYEAGGKKELQKNGVAYSRIANHVGLIPVVMVTPDDQLLIDEGSDERRRFMDGTISQIDHTYLENLIEYNRVLQQRNSALKHFAERRKTDRALIESYDRKLCDSGEKIFHLRTEYFSRMIPLIRQFHALLSSETEEVSAEYASVCNKENLAVALSASFEKDCITQRTNEGIHRDDFDFFLSKRSLKRFGSQGQKKSFLMSLKFAQYELIKREKNLLPLLLLDDLFDKLDEKRSRNIFRLIADNGFGQVFITDTHCDRVRELISQHPTSFTHYLLPDLKKCD